MHGTHSFKVTEMFGLWVEALSSTLFLFC